MIPLPPKLETLPVGTKLFAGLGISTILPSIDFETYSEAGCVFNPITNKFDSPLKYLNEAAAKYAKKSLPLVGAAVYSEHPSTEVLSMAYDLKNGDGPKIWRPGDSSPHDLFAWLNNGGVIQAWNVTFERWIWENVCVPKYGWIPLPPNQLRDAMAKSRAFALPGSLGDAGNVLNASQKKDKDGVRLLNKFSMPRNPTKNDTRKRIQPHEDPEDALRLYKYNLQDIVSENEISSLIPDLSPAELEFWLCDQAINHRGVQLDVRAAEACLEIVKQAHKKYNGEIFILTGGKVKSASEVQKIKQWMIGYGVHTDTLDSDDVKLLLKIATIPSEVRRVLEIRELIGSAAVKKLYSMLLQVTFKGRLHDLFGYHSARTGRAAGQGPQPQNLPNSGPVVSLCNNCKWHFKDRDGCPWCGHKQWHVPDVEWNQKAVHEALHTIASKSLTCVEHYWGNAIETVSGCLRGLFISAPRKDLICSDYSAIEAVVLAALAGEKWRMDVFNTHGKIYEMSASKVTGRPFEEYLKYKQETGKHHNDRKIGKVAELASGYQGWIGAWKQFDADEFMSEEEIKQAILAWRAASPQIVEFWGGQLRGWFPEYYGLEGAAVQAVLSPGTKFSYRGISYLVKNDVLYCELLSGRYLVYHKPRLAPSERKADTHSLSFEGWNTNPKQGAIGWVRMNTYGGKLTENVVQATARDILAHAIVNLEKAGYPVVLHVHDEIVAEIPENWGSVAEFEGIMSKLPLWAADWPVKANGGWIGKRYAK